MNMTFISVTKAAKKELGNRGGRSNLLVGEALGIAIHKSYQKRKYSTGTKYHLNIRMSPELIDSARMRKGDRVELLYDPISKKGLIRLDDKGYCLLGRKPILSFSIPFTEGYMPYEKRGCRMTEAKNVKVTSDGIIFDFPDVDYYE